MKKHKEKQIKIIIGIGDISGFGSYTLRVTNPEKEYLPFMNFFDQMVDSLKKKLRTVKETGDGFIVFNEIESEDGSLEAVELLRDLIKVGQHIKDSIDLAAWPHPDGFRSRLTAGHVWKKRITQQAPIYRGYHINLAAKLLEIEQDRSLICHESFKDLIKERSLKDEGIIFKQIHTQDASPDGVYSKDVMDLWEIITKR